MSTFMAKMLFTVSTSVSPFLTEELAAEKFTTSADNLFWANSNESLVLVEFSKKRSATVMSLSDGTFLIGLLSTSLNSAAVLKIISRPHVSFHESLVDVLLRARSFWLCIKKYYLITFRVLTPFNCNMLLEYTIYLLSHVCRLNR